MHKAIHLTHKALSVAVAFLLAAAMAVGFSFTPLVQDTQAYAAESTDIADAGIENCGTQYNISWWADDSYTSIPSAEAYKGSTTTSDGTVLYEGTDYTVTYDFSKVPSYSCAGDCSATLTGMGDYTGEVTFDYEVQAFTTIETGVGNVSVMYRRGFNELLESVDNSTPLMYQYDNTVVYVPAGQYITLDDFFAYYDIGECGNGEAKTWATIQNVNELYFNVDTTYDLETNVEGKWYPQQTTDSYSTEGATSVPCIYARQYGLKDITTTAEAAAEELASEWESDGYSSPDFYYAPYVFCGALESDYTAGNIPADRFLKNVTKFVVSRDIADLPFASIANQTYTGSAIDPIEADGGLELFDGFYLKPDEDFIYTISNNTEIGTATIEIEGTGSLDSDDQYYVENGWTGTTTLTFKITDSNTPDRTTTSVTFKNGDQTIFTFPLSTIEEWAESSTDNTSALMYEAVDGTDATAYYIPAGKYVTASTISSKIGATAWTSIAFENEDGSTYTVDNGTYYFYPNLSVSDGTITYDTSGMVEVPTVLAFEWYDEAITTDAESAAEDAMSGTANTAVCGFSGISSSDYSADGNLSNARFVTNADDVTMLGTYKTATLTDILAGQWYTEYVNSAVDLGLMTGYTGQNIFDPDGDLTRAQALTVIYRAVVSNSDDTKDPSLYASNETPFTDVESDMWYTAAINWAYKNGITTGYLGTDLFGVDDLINRAELATFIGRVASSIENIDISDADPSAAEECTDWETVVEDTPYAVESLEWTAAENILAGDENADGSRTMDPLGTALRSQMAKVIVDTLNVFLNGSVDVY